MTLFLLLLLAIPVLGQQTGPIGILRGDLIGLESDLPAGRLRMRVQGSLYECQFDSLTYIERERRRIPMSTIGAGERVEVVTDQKHGPGTCYARTVRVTYGDTPPAMGSRLSIRPVRSALDHLAPRGNLTFSAVLLRRNPEVLVVRTRNAGEQNLLLRADTRFMDSGLPSESAALPPNTRIFVRCGKNSDNELEAFQIIWGEIAGPKRW